MNITLTVAAFTTMLLGSTSAFVVNSNGPSSITGATGATSLCMAASSKQWPEVNGWVADSSKFCAGLPGSTAPLGEFDPLGLTADMTIEEIKRYRESEVTHGRVAMLATLGYLVGENFHPFFGGVVSGPANTHLAQVQEVAPAFFVALTVAIGGAELFRALTGWKAAESLQAANEDPNSAFGAVLVDQYYPGDIGFDPLGLKPTNAADFANMQTKELQNGRLAMFGAIGMLVQEQITHEPILATIKSMTA